MFPGADVRKSSLHMLATIGSGLHNPEGHMASLTSILNLAFANTVGLLNIESQGSQLIHLNDSALWDFPDFYFIV